MQGDGRTVGVDDIGLEFFYARGDPERAGGRTPSHPADSPAELFEVVSDRVDGVRSAGEMLRATLAFEPRLRLAGDEQNAFHKKYYTIFSRGAVDRAAKIWENIC